MKTTTKKDYRPRVIVCGNIGTRVMKSKKDKLSSRQSFEKFTKEMLESAGEIVDDNGLNDIQKYNELEDLLLGEGYDLDDMMDLLLDLHPLRKFYK